MGKGWRSREQDKCETLAQCVYRLVRTGQMQSFEFQSLLNYHGREKLGRLYKEEFERQRGKSNEAYPKSNFQKVIHDT